MFYEKSSPLKLPIYCTITLIVLLLKDINYELYIINLSLIAIMRVPYCYKIFIFIKIAILLLIDNTNLSKADSYDSYEYPGDEYPGMKINSQYF